MRSQQSANRADARLDTPETEPEPPSNAFSKKEEDIMAKDEKFSELDTQLPRIGSPLWRRHGNRNAVLFDVAKFGC